MAQSATPIEVDDDLNERGRATLAPRMLALRLQLDARVYGWPLVSLPWSSWPRPNLGDQGETARRSS